MTARPTGRRCGSGLLLPPMWTGPRVMMRLLSGENNNTGVKTNNSLFINKHVSLLFFPPHQYGRGQAIFCDVTLQISRQSHGQRTYFFPTGAVLIGCRKHKQEAGMSGWKQPSRQAFVCSSVALRFRASDPLTVASLQMLHFTTCWCILPSTDMVLWHTRQLTTAALPLSGLPWSEYGGGGSPGSTEPGNEARPVRRNKGEKIIRSAGKILGLSEEY